MRSLPRRERRAIATEVALDLLERHGPQLLLTARRYAATYDDAEDAVQRAFEILLSRPPAVSEPELLPWLKTVVKHEAFALRRQRERHSPVTGDGTLVDRPAPDSGADEQAERQERVARSAEALQRLKPHELRALVLRAQGYSYREICDLTSWSYTKLNRALTEGRRAFRTRVAAIEAGLECERFEPLLSRLADGEADADDLATLRPHLKTCLSCRVRLKEFRAMPGRVAAIAPASVQTVQSESGDGGMLRGLVESVVGAFQHKAAALGERAHAAAELATGQKVAAVAASAAALAGGGTAVEQLSATPDPPHVPAARVEQRADAISEETAAVTPTATTTAPAAAPTSPPAPDPSPPPPPSPANEFDPSVAASQHTSPQPVTAAGSSQPAAGSGLAPGGGPTSGGGGGGSGEFTP